MLIFCLLQFMFNNRIIPKNVICFKTVAKLLKNPLFAKLRLQIIAKTPCFGFV
jgi:hypothetical protein